MNTAICSRVQSCFPAFSTISIIIHLLIKKIHSLVSITKTQDNISIHVNFNCAIWLGNAQTLFHVCVVKKLARLYGNIMHIAIVYVGSLLSRNSNVCRKICTYSMLHTYSNAFLSSEIASICYGCMYSDCAFCVAIYFDMHTHTHTHTHISEWVWVAQ